MRGAFIDPGRLRHELLLQQATVADDGAGGHSETWTEVAPVFAQIEPFGARSFFGAGQDMEEATHRVIIRHRGDVRSGMRFLRAGRILHIVRIHDIDETGRYLACHVREEGR
ncbi:phage head closure protein [Nitratireductor thuwali]|uniref:Head-tail adaptor protein n=1 Tax=Nitratireductor thuwali TaxID=2267699 RepID=A0ABY5MNT7_9HYPH|nr:hypothetical protein NTH_03402 [Nitratireductor thuwali]